MRLTGRALGVDTAPMEPVPLSALRGHRAQLAVLSRAVLADGCAHAWLFSGPPGVGKTTAASALLGALACTNRPRPTADACGKCPSCSALRRDEHPDVKVLRRDGQVIKIEQVREATARLRYAPVVARIKAVLIEDAETLHETAGNALLKSLEEPARDVVFVLVTSRPQLLLDTIRSRCQGLRFAELPPDDVAAILRAEGHTQDAARIAAALAQGSLHEARTLCNPQRLQAVDDVAAFVARLGLGPATEAALFVDRIAASLDTGAEHGSDDGAVRRADLTRPDVLWVVDVARAVLRDALLLDAGFAADELPYQRHVDALRALGQRVGAPALARVLDRCQELDTRMVLNPNPRLALAALLTDAGVAVRNTVRR
ncbi:MAG: DNA polymerase III subunit delta' [Myxococcales bacterium]|nr:DNA polymerase III subunit delta' [Myxococcales bacterium]